MKSNNIKVFQKLDVSLKDDIAQSISKGVVALKQTFVHRVLVFSVSGTYIVDLKDKDSTTSRLSCRLLPDYLADFLS